MTAFVIVGSASLLLGLAAAFLIAKRYALPARATWTLLGMGAAGWLLAKIPKGLIVFSAFIAKGLPLQMDSTTLEHTLKSDFSLLLVAAVSAGVFEEAIKPIALYFSPNSRRVGPGFLLGTIIGLGAGTVESLNFHVGAVLGAAMQQTSIGGLLDVPVERLLAVAFHAALTAMVVHFAFRRRGLTGLAIAASIHTLADLVLPWLQLHGWTDTWSSQLLFAALVVLTIGVAVAIVRTPAQRTEHA